MRCLTEPITRPALLRLADAPGFDAGINRTVRAIKSAPDDAAVISHMGEAVRQLGLDSMFLVLRLRPEGGQPLYRQLAWSDPHWVAEYMGHRWFEADPWLQHCSVSARAAVGDDIRSDGPVSAAMLDRARALGFRSVMVVPAASNMAAARVASLTLGSAEQGYFDADSFDAIRPTAIGLAMELTEWLLASLKQRLQIAWGLSERETWLLRMEIGGLSSKQMAAELGIATKTVDSSFFRLAERLGASGRKEVVSVAKLLELV